MRKNIHAYRVIGVILLLAILILDMVNISCIIHTPIHNINLDLWNIILVIVLYIFTYVIINKRENTRKKNQEELAKMLLEDTYKTCNDYKNMIDDAHFKKVCSKRFPGDQTMENNTAYDNMRKAPFEHDSIIFSFGESGVIIASDILNYINVKNRYSVYFSNVVIFHDMDNVTNPLKNNLEKALDRAIQELDK